jgi:hypothetical protein
VIRLPCERLSNRRFECGWKHSQASALSVRGGRRAATVGVGSPADFSKIIAAEIEKWANVIEFAASGPNSSGEQIASSHRWSFGEGSQ